MLSQGRIHVWQDRTNKCSIVDGDVLGRTGQIRAQSRTGDVLGRVGRIRAQSRTETCLVEWDGYLLIQGRGLAHSRMEMCLVERDEYMLNQRMETCLAERDEYMLNRGRGCAWQGGMNTCSIEDEDVHAVLAKSSSLFREPLWGGHDNVVRTHFVSYHRVSVNGHGRSVLAVAELLSYIGLRHPLLTSNFKPLSDVELPDRDSPPTAAHISGSEDGDHHIRMEKLTVVLDLDETLVCAYETSSFPAIIHNQATDAGLNWFDLECLSSGKECEGQPKVNHVTVFERPGLQEFLKQISEFADLVLFTAGLEGYARPLVDRIDIEKRFSLRLYRPSTISTEYREHVKDLSCLSKGLCRTVIVDNNPFSFLLQPLNGIPCIPFSAGQPYDDQLLEVLLPLLKHLSLQKDVRPVLYERFHMPEWFQKHGIPASDWTL
ncbi:hypothetical protein HHK36_016200 [Tetracentron sinense]|uniref:FCP1 homology domain-containing protein n=1 Tax=Tetracentron sinense TaxID=13715 RepID=A0A834YZV1_TETSI|nr:hypothetical protein HHK36_016200 [Tetracentron sinense]